MPMTKHYANQNIFPKIGDRMMQLFVCGFLLAFLRQFKLHCTSEPIQPTWTWKYELSKSKQSETDLGIH